MPKHFAVVFSVALLGGCGAGNNAYDARFLEKYLLDGERALQENDTDRAERMFRCCQAHGEKLGTSDWRLALAEARLGKVLVANHKDAEAKKVLASAVLHFRTAKTGRQTSAALIDKELGEAESLLGMLLLDGGDFNLARAYLEESAALLKTHWSSVIDESQRDTLAGVGYARSLFGLARLHERDGDWLGAMQNYEGALAVVDQERVSVPLREDISLAFVKFLISKGRHDKAKEVEQKQQQYASFNPGGAKAIARDQWRKCIDKGQSAMKDREYVKASQYFQDALPLTSAFAKDGEERLSTLEELALAKQCSGDAEAAIKLVKQAEDLAIKLGGENSTFLDNTLFVEQRILTMQQKYDQLEAVLQRQVKLRASMRGEDNLHVAESLVKLGDCQIGLGKSKEGTASYRKAIEIFEQDAQRNSKDLKVAYDKMIAVLEKDGNASAAGKFRISRSILEKQMIKWDQERKPL